MQLDGWFSFFTAPLTAPIKAITGRGNVISNIGKAGLSPITSPLRGAGRIIGGKVGHFIESPANLMERPLSVSPRELPRQFFRDIRNPVKMTYESGATPFLTEKSAANIDRFGNKYVAPVAAAVLAPFTGGLSMAAYAAMQAADAIQASKEQKALARKQEEQAALEDKQRQIEIEKQKIEDEKYLDRMKSLQEQIHAIDSGIESGTTVIPKDKMLENLDPEYIAQYGISPIYRVVNPDNTITEKINPLYLYGGGLVLLVLLFGGKKHASQ